MPRSLQPDDVMHTFTRRDGQQGALGVCQDVYIRGVGASLRALVVDVEKLDHAQYARVTLEIPYREPDSDWPLSPPTSGR